MKKILHYLVFTLVLTTSLYGQTYKTYAKQFSYRYVVYGEWTEWSEWEDITILVVTNLDKMKITIYSKEIQDFDIVKVYETEFDSEGNKVFTFLCVDSNGLKCNIRERFTDGQLFSSQLYVDYKDIMYVYNIERD